MSRRTRTIAALTVVLLTLGVPAYAQSSSSHVDTAACSFDITGHADPGNTGISPVGLDGGPVDTPADNVLGQAKRNTYTLSGPVRCTGSIEGHNLNGDDGHGRPKGLGQMTATGADPASPLTDPFEPQDGSQGTTNACLVVNIPFRLTVKLPGMKPLQGQFTLQSVLFDFFLVGNLGNARLVGRAGLGANPEGSQGECKNTSPYHDWGVQGNFALSDVAVKPAGGTPTIGAAPQPDAPPPPPLSTDPHSASVLVPIAQFQYVGGGTINGPDGTDPSTAVNGPGIKVIQGDRIVFENLDTHPHTVTSCSVPDCRADNEVQVPGLAPIGDTEKTKCLGTEVCPNGAFDSEQALDAPGGNWTLDTSTLQPGSYNYFCEFHRWMRGTFDVIPHE